MGTEGGPPATLPGTLGPPPSSPPDLNQLQETPTVRNPDIDVADLRSPTPTTSDPVVPNQEGAQQSPQLHQTRNRRLPGRFQDFAIPLGMTV
ncbi:hypothetical protein EOD39_12558 [Acipenser ruthenus]|uniref:Uncharacterized protein n=1 Tax=Acipenser ruthenus TaxID=7906 RepID=A0A662YQQ4_ACIRT|nr:hypothetical protein EOD39_12558 [Acipenser ruthenus]